MKQEEILKALIEELFAMDTLHQEYQDNDSHFVVDSTREGNTLTIKVQLLENKDKKEFEKWLQQVDDDLFQEVLDELAEKEGLKNIDNLYNSENYQQVIDRVRSKTKELAARKIKDLKKLLS
jgi:hypothetical protein